MKNKTYTSGDMAGAMLMSVAFTTTVVVLFGVISIYYELPETHIGDDGKMHLK